MSTAAADAGAAPAKGGKKKLILIIAVAVVLLAVAAVGAVLLLKPKPADDDEDFADARAPVAAAKPIDPKSAPAYVPLDPFTVNLADREADRYAQIAVTLELAEPAHADAIKAFMPAIRNNILMTLAHKTSRELMERDGKARLAEQIRRDTARGLGLEVDDEALDAAEAPDERPRGKRRRAAPAPLPVTAVYFSTFIVQ